MHQMTYSMSVLPSSTKFTYTVEGDTTMPIRRVNGEVVVNHDRRENRGSEMDSIPEFPSVRSSLARKRSQYYPPIAATISHVCRP
jgi:hypothetical protein